MKAILCRAFGPVADLVPEEVPAPRPGPHEVLIRAAACAANFADRLMVRGRDQAHTDQRFPPGGKSKDAEEGGRWHFRSR